MNKLLILTTLLCGLGGALPAHAYNRNDYAGYLGIGLDRTFFQGKNTTPQPVSSLGRIALSPPLYATFMTGKSAFVGFNLCGVGAEFGYTQFDNIYYPSLTFNGFFPQKVTGKQSGNNVYVDGIFYYQFCGNWVAKGRLGCGYLTTKYTVITNSPNNQFKNYFESNKFGIRAGAALQWNIARCWSLDLGYIYQVGNDLQKNLQSIRFDVNLYLMRFTNKGRGY